ncbi:MAG: four helix bundle protein [Bacteroidota bacterium]|nr:four helix bundle protein [Bacteroidota bacterium]
MTHKDLEVWKKSIDFVTRIYDLTKEYPKEELFGLVSQIRRAAVSIPSNIAEGASRKGKTEFRHFLYISLASGAELETQLIISGNLNYISKEKQTELIEELNIISKMLQGLIKSLNLN